MYAKRMLANDKHTFEILFVNKLGFCHRTKFDQI